MTLRGGQAWERARTSGATTGSSRGTTRSGRRTRRRGYPGEKIGATLYEIPPEKTGGYYHFHHGAEELLVVLRGRPTLREPAGERVLEAGDVVHFAVGPEGAHQLLNRTDEPVRYLMVSNLPSPEAVEYPDTRQISVMAFTESQLGRPLWDMRTLEAAE
jgi:uncharacterized cupin superfamily protein